MLNQYCLFSEGCGILCLFVLFCLRIQSFRTILIVYFWETVDKIWQLECFVYSHLHRACEIHESNEISCTHTGKTDLTFFLHTQQTIEKHLGHSITPLLTLFAMIYHKAIAFSGPFFYFVFCSTFATNSTNLNWPSAPLWSYRAFTYKPFPGLIALQYNLHLYSPLHTNMIWRLCPW